MKLKDASAQLNTLKALHHQAILTGWCAKNNHINDENNLTVLYDAEFRGRYGYIPSVYIATNTPPVKLLSVMTTEQAYKYANLGHSVLAGRDLMRCLPWD